MRMRYVGLASLLLLAACGGGGGGSSNPAPTGSNPPTSNPPAGNSNRAPIVALENPTQVAVHRHAFSYDAAQGGRTFSDPDGDSLTYDIKLGHTYNPYNDPNPPRGWSFLGTRIFGRSTRAHWISRSGATDP